MQQIEFQVFRPMWILPDFRRRQLARGHAMVISSEDQDWILVRIWDGYDMNI